MLSRASAAASQPCRLATLRERLPPSAPPCYAQRPMFAFIITVHIIVSIFMIFVILLQPGKGEGMGTAFGGGGGANTVFGGRGSVTFLSKVTSACAIVFMLTSLTLAYRSSHSDSVLRARRNLAARDSTKKDAAGSTKPALPTGQTAPAPATGGAAVPVPGTTSAAPAQPVAAPPAAKAQPAAPAPKPAGTPASK